MTFEELDQSLPNGFHDAEIRKIEVDFTTPSIVIGMNLHVGAADDPDPERYRAGTVTIDVPYVFFIEPPDAAYHFIPNGSPINASGNSVKAGQNPKVDRLLGVLPPNATSYLFFLDDWNSSIYLSGASAKFSWDDGDPFQPFKRR
jgi:hypothetical protein